MLRLSGIGLLEAVLGWQRMRNSRGKESLLVVVRIKENGDVCTQTSPFLASFLISHQIIERVCVIFFCKFAFHGSY